MVTKEQLIELINKGFTRKQVAEELGIGYSTVHKYMSKYGLVFLAHENRTSGFLCKCGETDENKFYNGRKIQCKKCFNEETIKKIKLNKEFAVGYKGGKCQVCGYSKCISALEFHHRDPSEKDPKWRMGWSIDRLKTELDKCDLLCANCHREEHERLSGVRSTDRTSVF